MIKPARAAFHRVARVRSFKLRSPRAQLFIASDCVVHTQF